MHEQLQLLMGNHAALLENLRNLAQQFEDTAKLAVETGHQINRLSTLVEAPINPSHVTPPKPREWEHHYPGIVDGKFIRTSDCAYGCGAWMGGSRSGAPAGIDAFGACPAKAQAANHVHEIGSCICDTWPSVPKAEPLPAVDHVSDTVPFAADDSPETLAAMDGNAHVPNDEHMATVFAAIDNVPPASEVRPVVSHELGAEQSGPRRCNTCERKATTVRGNCASCDEIELSAAPPNLGETSPPSGVRKKNEFTAAEWVVSMHFLKYMKKAPFNSWTAEQQRETADLFVAHANKEWPSLRMNKWGERFSKFCGV